jgi:hypothetical protein
VIDASTSSSDERDAARLAVLCIDTSLSVGDMTLYKVEPEGRAFERETLISYLEGLAKPIAIHADREAGGAVLLRIAPRRPYKGVAPLDIGKSVCEQHGVDQSALILIKGEDDVRFTMRLAGLSLWQHSYEVNVEHVMSGYDPDDAGRALGVVAMFLVGRLGPGPHFSSISLY